jgi:hypothetical protein
MPSTIVPLSSFTIDGAKGMAFGSTSSRVALPGTPANDALVVVTNVGSLPVYVALGGNTVVAAVGTSALVLAGQQRVFALGSATYIAGIVSGSNSGQNGILAVETGN